MKEKSKENWIELGLFLIAAITLIGATISYGVDNLATKREVSQVNARVDEFKSMPTDIAVIKVEMQQINKKLDKL